MKIDPPSSSVSFWLKSQKIDQIHDVGWIEVNRRFHGIARAARTYFNENYEDEADRQAAFDGFTLALMAIARFEDIENLMALTDDWNSEKLSKSNEAKKNYPAET